MNSVGIILLLIFIVLSMTCFVIAYLQFKGKGFLFNNAYIYGSKEERKKLNKTPYYRQSAIVFTGVGLNFILLASNTMIKNNLITFANVGLMILLCVYALVSTVQIMTKAK